MGTLLPEELTKNKLWSANVLVNHPNEIKKVHQAYYKSGADIAITASYQASTIGFVENGICQNSKESIEIMKRSVNIARESKCRDDQLVAGSIGPYGAYLANGEEYSGNYGNVTKEQLKEFHKDRIKALESADLLAIETIPNIMELEALMDMVDMNCWVSLSLADDNNKMADGTLLSQALKVIESNQNVIAVGFNCYPLDKSTAALTNFNKLAKLPLILYPNSGEAYDSETKAWITSTESKENLLLASQAARWVELNAKIIGGCCRTTPKDIQNLHDSINKLYNSN